ncbi:hypothetical protein ABZ926_14045 [Streptomyces litmocidini]
MVKLLKWLKQKDWRPVRRRIRLWLPVLAATAYWVSRMFWEFPRM